MRCWRLRKRACSRGLKASPRARFTPLSRAGIIPSMARRCQCWRVMNRIPSWRQTSAALHRSVHTASTAWAFSGALWALAAWRVLVLAALFEVIDEFFVFVSIVDREFEFSFFGPEDNRLPFHAADHVEGSLRSEEHTSELQSRLHLVCRLP